VQTAPQSYEIRAFSTTSLPSDDAFLRLRAGGSTNANQASYIDISGSSTVPDMSRNIVFGVAGTEVMRVDGNGLTVASGYNITIPANTPTTSTITFTGGGVSAAIPITYTKNGSKVSIQFGSSGARSFTSSASFLNGPIPAGLTPPTSGYQPMWCIPVMVNGTYTPVNVFLNASIGRFEVYSSVAMNGWVSGNQVQWTGFTLDYFVL
jgi:hypothetical protein